MITFSFTQRFMLLSVQITMREGSEIGNRSVGVVFITMKRLGAAIHMFCHLQAIVEVQARYILERNAIALFFSNSQRFLISSFLRNHNVIILSFFVFHAMIICCFSASHSAPLQLNGAIGALGMFGGVGNAGGLGNVGNGELGFIESFQFLILRFPSFSQSSILELPTRFHSSNLA